MPGSLRVSTGSYAGTGVAQSIAHTAGRDGWNGSHYVLMIGRSTTDGQPNNSCLKTAAMAATTSYAAFSFAVTTAVTAVSSSSFTLGTHASVNNSGDTYNFLLIADIAGITGETPVMQVSTYSGNSTDDRNLNFGWPWTPDYVLHHSLTGTNETPWRHVSQDAAGDASAIRWTNPPVATGTDGIQSLISGGIQVGVGTYVNATGTDYGVVGFKFTANQCDGSTYDGNDTDDRNISHPTFAFQPELTWIQLDEGPVGGQRVVWRGSHHVGDSSSGLGDFASAGIADGANRLQGFHTAGFQVGNGTGSGGLNVNQLIAGTPGEYLWLSFRSGDLPAAGSAAVKFSGGFFQLPFDPYTFYKSSLAIFDRYRNVRLR